MKSYTVGHMPPLLSQVGMGMYSYWGERGKPLNKEHNGTLPL
jgi:hypothetical protein